MEGGTSLLSQILLENVSPVVMVLSTTMAEAVCAKNNLGFVDLLRPFCILDRINVPVRTASETPYRLQHFRLRLFYSSEIQPTPMEEADQHITKLIANASEAALDELNGDPRNLQIVQQMVQMESTSSWHQKCSSAFTRSLAFSDHETFDHPVACMLVVSTKDDNPVNAFANLSNANNLPPLLNAGVMDPRILKHYVILHDNQDGTPQRANETLKDVCGTYDPNCCSLVRINSAENTGPSVDDIWSAHMHEKNDKLKLGCCLQKNDIDEIQNFILDFSQKHVIPYMEQKVRLLNQQVAATRRGLKNQLKNLWWRKKDSDVPETNGAIYTFNSVESQIRVLADYSFMLRDYELALSNYRLLSVDYKADKAHKRYAGVMEMIGICLCLLDQSRKEADNSLESAFITYQMLGLPASRYATRTALWWSEVHKARRQYPEAAYVLFRVAVEMHSAAHLQAGVLLEQSAYCYLRCTPPMLRKYGFHLVLAGTRYNAGGQKKHALRAYMGVSSLYDGQGWHYISDHVNVHLGRISSFLGQQDAAVQHFMKILACSHQPAPMQAIFLKDFLSAVQSLGMEVEVLPICLPAIRPQYIYVRFEDHRTYASSAAASLPEDVWISLEEGLVPATTPSVTTWLDKTTKQAKDFNVSVAGENVAVVFDVSNPLQIAIEVSSMELICDFKTKSEEANESTNSEILVLSKESFSLKGGENHEVCLTVKPMKEGKLQIVGVKWILCGIVPARYDFSPLGEGRKSKSKQGKAELPPHQRLKFHVLEHMPRLEIAMHELPLRLNKGELRRIVLELQNSSHASIRNLKLKTSHPGFLMVGSQGDLDLEFPNCLEVAKEDNTCCELGSSIFCFPQDITLDGKSTLLWPLWLHARDEGEFTFSTVVYFEACGPTSLKHRTVRMSYALQVIPSLQVYLQVSPSPVRLEHYLMRIDVRNSHGSESFWLRQVSCIGDEWSFTPLQQTAQCETSAYLSASVSPSQLLPAMQSSSLFFVLKKKRDDLQMEDNGGNVQLGAEPLVNVRAGPLSYFHQQEKLLQQNLDQAPSVDIVLITGQQDDMITEKTVGSRDSFRFASHHLCHCRVESPQELVWAMEGPRCIQHDFMKQPVCEVSVSVALRNCSQSTVLIEVETVDPDDVASPGWRSASPPPTLEDLASSASPTLVATHNKLVPCGSYMWSTFKSVTCLQLASGESTKVPLIARVFASGAYDLSSYKVRWRLVEVPPTGSGKKGKKGKLVATPATVAEGGFVLETKSSSEVVAVDKDEIVTAGHSFLITLVQAG